MMRFSAIASRIMSIYDYHSIEDGIKNIKKTSGSDKAENNEEALTKIEQYFISLISWLETNGKRL